MKMSSLYLRQKHFTSAVITKHSRAKCPERIHQKLKVVFWGGVGGGGEISCASNSRLHFFFKLLKKKISKKVFFLIMVVKNNQIVCLMSGRISEPQCFYRLIAVYIQKFVHQNRCTRMHAHSQINFFNRHQIDWAVTNLFSYWTFTLATNRITSTVTERSGEILMNSWGVKRNVKQFWVMFNRRTAGFTGIFLKLFSNIYIRRVIKIL